MKRIIYIVSVITAVFALLCVFSACNKSDTKKEPLTVVSQAVTEKPKDDTGVMFVKSSELDTSDVDYKGQIRFAAAIDTPYVDYVAFKYATIRPDGIKSVFRTIKLSDLYISLYAEEKSISAADFGLDSGYLFTFAINNIDIVEYSNYGVEVIAFYKLNGEQITVASKTFKIKELFYGDSIIF